MLARDFAQVFTFWPHWHPWAEVTCNVPERSNACQSKHTRQGRQLSITSGLLYWEESIWLVWWCHVPTRGLPGEAARCCVVWLKHRLALNPLSSAAGSGLLHCCSIFEAAGSQSVGTAAKYPLAVLSPANAWRPCCLSLHGESEFQQPSSLAPPPTPSHRRAFCCQWFDTPTVYLVDLYLLLCSMLTNPQPAVSFLWLQCSGVRVTHPIWRDNTCETTKLHSVFFFSQAFIWLQSSQIVFCCLDDNLPSQSSQCGNWLSAYI